MLRPTTKRSFECARYPVFSSRPPTDRSAKARPKQTAVSRVASFVRLHWRPASRLRPLAVAFTRRQPSARLRATCGRRRRWITGNSEEGRGRKVEEENRGEPVYHSCIPNADRRRPPHSCRIRQIHAVRLGGRASVKKTTGTGQAAAAAAAAAAMERPPTNSPSSSFASVRNAPLQVRVSAWVVDWSVLHGRSCGLARLIAKINDNDGGAADDATGVKDHRRSGNGRTDERGNDFERECARPSTLFDVVNPGRVKRTSATRTYGTGQTERQTDPPATISRAAMRS